MIELTPLINFSIMNLPTRHSRISFAWCGSSSISNVSPSTMSSSSDNPSKFFSTLLDSAIVKINQTKTLDKEAMLPKKELSKPLAFSRRKRTEHLTWREKISNSEKLLENFESSYIYNLDQSPA